MVAALAVGIGLGSLVDKKDGAGDREPAKVEISDQAAVLENGRPIATFSLLDQQAQTFSNESLQGQWSLMFFGFTYCPDVCPTALYVVNEAVKQLAQPPQVYLVSVDPERDTPKKLAAYLPHFNPSFNGITGNRPEIDAFARSLGVAHSKGAADENGHYEVAHSDAFMLINPKGEIAAYLSSPHIPATLAEDIAAISGTTIRD